MLHSTRRKIICALDFSDEKRAFKMAEDLSELIGMYKVGLELYTTTGPLVLSQMCAKKYSVFLDLKFHDIPNTVSKAINNFRGFNKYHRTIEMLTVHAAGEKEMIQTAVRSAGDIDVIAVTLLTSMTKKNSSKIVSDYTEMALEAGAAGVVCSAHEVKKLRKKFGDDFKIIVPGCRPTWYDSNDDQKRTGTPSEIINSGANFLVVGRPIISYTCPKSAAYNINKELESCLSKK